MQTRLFFLIDSKKIRWELFGEIITNQFPDINKKSSEECVSTYTCFNFLIAPRSSNEDSEATKSTQIEENPDGFWFIWVDFEEIYE